MNRFFKWITFVFEGVLAIPILGGALIVANGWTPLFAAGILHAAAIVILLMSRRFVLAGNLIGLTGALLGWIPVVGWILHAAAAIVLFIEAVYLTMARTDRVRYS